MRLAAILLAAGLHLLVLAALVRGFAPGLANDVAQSFTVAFDIPAQVPQEPPPRSDSAPDPAPEREEGAAAPPARNAKPRHVSAPKPKVAIATEAAAPVSGKGSENAAGAAAFGPGTGAAGVGSGTGAGASGAGQGGGGRAVTKLVKVAGEISSARDYPRASRGLRIGHRVGILLSVGRDGRVTACRITDPSPDAEADRITCRLAIERFRFEPARDAAGNPVPGLFKWYQRWFT